MTYKFNGIMLKLTHMTDNW